MTAPQLQLSSRKKISQSEKQVAKRWEKCSVEPRKKEIQTSPSRSEENVGGNQKKRKKLAKDMKTKASRINVKNRGV